MVFERDEFCRDTRDSIDIRREECPPFTDSDDHRTSELCSKDHIRMLAIRYDECIGSDELREDCFECVLEITIIHIFEELRDDFCISLRVEFISFLLERFPELMVVLDDTIMYDEKSHITREVWVCIFLSHASMCRPASMCDTGDIRFISICTALDSGREIRHFSYGLLKEEFS